MSIAVTYFLTCRSVQVGSGLGELNANDLALIYMSMCWRKQSPRLEKLPWTALVRTGLVTIR
jgi:hypothetical protein